MANAVFAPSAAFVPPDDRSVAPLELHCLPCYPSSLRLHADSRPYALIMATNAKPAAFSSGTATVAAGDIHVAIKEWGTPTLRSHPHDPLVTSDGAIWFTASFKGYIGKLDPITSEVREFRLPDPTAQGPHTPVFDQNGTLWFTVIGGNKLGRLEPATGEIKLVSPPTAHSLSYGLLVNSQGTPFFAEFGSNRIARMEPSTMQIEEFPLSNPEARPRRIAVTTDDVIWYTDYPRGYLGRLDPKTGQVTEWPSPGGGDSGPYAIAAVDDIVWYVESARSPNVLVHFDPKTETFETWPIPSGGGVVRNMATMRIGGGLALACSGVDMVALVEITKRAN